MRLTGIRFCFEFKFVGLLVLLFVLLLHICRGRPTVAAAVSFSVGIDIFK